MITPVLVNLPNTHSKLHSLLRHSQQLLCWHQPGERVRGCWHRSGSAQNSRTKGPAGPVETGAKDPRCPRTVPDETCHSFPSPLLPCTYVHSFYSSQPVSLTSGWGTRSHFSSSSQSWKTGKRKWKSDAKLASPPYSLSTQVGKQTPRENTCPKWVQCQKLV